MNEKKPESRRDLEPRDIDVTTALSDIKALLQPALFKNIIEVFPAAGVESDPGRTAPAGRGCLTCKTCSTCSTCATCATCATCRTCSIPV